MELSANKLSSHFHNLYGRTQPYAIAGMVLASNKTIRAISPAFV